MLSVQSNVWVKPQFMVKKTVHMGIGMVHLQRKKTSKPFFLVTVMLFQSFIEQIQSRVNAYSFV